MDDTLDATLLERAIGVIYLPRIEPLERNVRWLQGEAPETFPSGM